MTARAHLCRSLLGARFRWACAAAVLLCALAPGYWTALRHPIAGTYHDDGIYLITAKALATGQGYSIISLPHALAQTKYPPVYPWLLSLAWRLNPSFPANLPALVTISTLALLAWLTFLYLLGKQEQLSRPALFFLLSLVACSTWVFGVSTMALSDSTFAALCTGSLLLLQIAETRTSGTLKLVGCAAVLAALACLTRAAGLALPATAVLWFIAKRRYKAAIVFSGVVLLFLGPWQWYGAVHSGSSSFAEAYYSSQSYRMNSTLAQFSVPQKIIIACVNLLNFVFNSAHLLNLTGAPVPLLLTADFVVLLGFGLGARRRFDLPVLFVSLYLLLLTIVCGGLGPRYALPVFPLLLLIGCRGLKVRRPAVRLATVAAAMLLLGHSVWKFHSAAERVTTGQKSWAFKGDQNPEELFRLTEWITRETDRSAILSANIDPFFYLYTGRRSIRSFNPDFYEMFYSSDANNRKPVGSPDHFREELRVHRVDYIVLTADKDYLEAPYLHSLVHQIALEQPDWLQLVYQGRTAEYQIYSVNRGKL